MRVADTELAEACPDVVLQTMAWQNTPADSTFNVNPSRMPFSPDVFCGGYQIAVAARGTVSAYEVFSFVVLDFWTDLTQGEVPQPIPEIRPAFGLPLQ